MITRLHLVKMSTKIKIVKMSRIVSQDKVQQRNGMTQTLQIVNDGSTTVGFKKPLVGNRRQKVPHNVVMKTFENKIDECVKDEQKLLWNDFNVSLPCDSIFLIYNVSCA